MTFYERNQMTERRPAPSFLPATAVLEMTYKCNHECIFCSCPWFAPQGEFTVEREMSVSEWKHVISKLCSMGCVNLAFTGGEPLLKKGIEEIIEFAAGQKVELIETEDGKLVSRIIAPKLFLLSNGKIMDNNILGLCRKHNINLSLSLPGLETYPDHTCGGGYADDILAWFRLAKEAGVTTTAGITITKKNQHEIFETVSAALFAGADTILLNRFMPGGRGLFHEKELRLQPEAIPDLLSSVDEILQNSGRTGSVGTELPYCLLQGRTFKNLTVGTRCSAALDFFVVGPSGYIRVCNHSTKRLEHVSEIEKLKMNPYWRRFTFKDYLPKQCGNCRDSIICDGGCREAAHISGGSIDSPDPLLKSME